MVRRCDLCTEYILPNECGTAADEQLKEDDDDDDAKDDTIPSSPSLLTVQPDRGHAREFFFLVWPFSFSFFVDISTMEINILTSSCTHLEPFKFVNNVKTIRNH